MQILKNGNKQLKKKAFVLMFQNQRLILKMLSEPIIIVIVAVTLLVNHMV